MFSISPSLTLKTDSSQWYDYLCGTVGIIPLNSPLVWPNHTRDQRRRNHRLFSNHARMCCDHLWSIQSLPPFLNSRYMNQWIWIHHLWIRILTWHKVTSGFAVVSSPSIPKSRPLICSPANVTSQAPLGHLCSLYWRLPATNTASVIILHNPIL